MNTAARLEGANKYLGTNICLSENTLSGCPGTIARPIGRLVLKGKSQALQIFEPVTSERQKKYAPADEYANAYTLMAENATTAIDAFHGLAAHYPDDPLVALHHRRLSAGECGDLIRLNEK